MNNEDNIGECPVCRHKDRPRSGEQLRSLKNRINRINGQLGGISNMLDDNRYCGDILLQLAAVQSAVRSLSCEILRDHMETCVADEIKHGNTEIINETMELIKKLR